MENETMSFIQSFNFVNNNHDTNLKALIVSKIQLETLKTSEFNEALHEQKLIILKNLTNILSKIIQDRDSNNYEQFEMLIYNQQMIISISKNEVKEAIHMTLININNMASYLFINDQVLVAKLLLKFLRKHLTIKDHHLDYITLLNLSRIHYSYQNFEKSFYLAEQALFKQELFVFNQMKQQPSALLEDPKEIILLLNGYLILAKSLEKIDYRQNLSPQQFFQNGHRLGRKYLGQNHFITKRFLAYEKNQPSEFKKTKKEAGSMSNIYVDKQCRQMMNSIKKELLINTTPGQSESISSGRQNQFHLQESKFKIRQVSVQSNQQTGINEKCEPKQLQVKKINSARSPHLALMNDGESAANQEYGIKTNRVSSVRSAFKPHETNQKDIEIIVEKKFDNLYKTQNSFQKQIVQKIQDMEVKMNSLQTENTNLQTQKYKDIRQITELEKLLMQLGEDFKQMKEKQKEQDSSQEIMKKRQSIQQQWQDNHPISIDSQQKVATMNDRSVKRKSSINQVSTPQKINSMGSEQQFKSNNLHQIVSQQKSNIINQNEFYQSTNSITSNTKVPFVHISDEMSTIKEYNSNSEVKDQQTLERVSIQSNNNAIQKKLNKLTSAGEQQNINNKPQIRDDLGGTSVLSQKDIEMKNSLGSKFIQVQSPRNEDYYRQNSYQEINSIISTLSQNKPIAKSITNNISNFSDSLASNDTVQFNFIAGINNLIERDDYTISIPLQTDIILSKLVLLEGVLYDLSCSIIRNKEFQLKLKANQVDCTEQSANNTALFSEKIEYLDLIMLTDILPLTNFKQILPFSVPLKSIYDHKTFIQYLVMPFVGVISQNNVLKVEIWPLAPGMLSEQTTVWFFEEECQLSLHYLQGKEFRLIFSSQKHENVQFKLDLLYDDSSIEIFFERLGQDEMAICEIEDMVKLTEIYDDQEFNDQSRQEQAKLLATRKNRSKNFHLPSYKIKDLNGLLFFLEKIKNDIQIYLTKNYNIKKFIDLQGVMEGKSVRVPPKINGSQKLSVIAMKVWHKAQRQRIVIVGDNLTDKCFEIQLANLFETHAPRQSKIKAEGYSHVKYDEVSEKIGLQSDKTITQYLLLDMFELDVFELELDPEDYDRYRLNMILEIGIESECNFRLFQTIDNFKIPITLCFIGINENPMGIKIQQGDLVEMKQKGVFLFLNNFDVWMKQEKDKQDQSSVKKKRVRKFLIERKLSNKYHLTSILNRIGWKIIFNSLNMENQDIFRILPNKSQTSIDRLDNILNFQNLLEILSK